MVYRIESIMIFRKVVILVMIFEQFIIIAGAKADTKPTGFLWYNEKLEKKSNNNPESLSKSKPKIAKNYNQRIEALKQKFNTAQRIALDNPTLANVIVAQKLQKQIMEKAQRFANMWQLATLLDHQLTNINEPTNSLHKKLYEERLEKDNDLKLENLAQNWGLILQVDNNCSYCKAFIPIVKQFADKYRFQLIFVSNNGLGSEQTVKDTGLLQALNPKNIVPVLYLVASNGQKIYPIARGIVSEDKIIDNIMSINLYYHKLFKVEINNDQN